MDLDLLTNVARPWLKLLDNIRNLDIDEKLPIPQICVFGDQSSGKSSLLESIAGIPELFPKGTGLVTRCPTKINLILCSTDTKWSAIVSVTPIDNEARKLGNSKYTSLEEKIYDMKELPSKLKQAADIILEKAPNGFSRNPIHITIESPTTPDLSIIDLPGIIRTTTIGQDRSVINEVNSMLSDYMRQPETIILALIPANQDIATIDVLERASQFDPTGVRTIGVLTKPDLVDKGTEEDILEVVQNRRKPLSLGYVMVKNRNQAELKSSMSLTECIQKEDEYFSSHEVWCKIESASRGIKSLCDRLTRIIVSRAMDRGPYIKWLLTDKLSKIEEKLNSLGIELPFDDIERGKLLVSIITKFTQSLRRIILGDFRDDLTRNDVELRIKYHISEILKELKVHVSSNKPDFDSSSYETRLISGIRDMRGRELPGFISTRQLLCTIAPELHAWRAHVEETIAQAMFLFKKMAQNLAFKYTEQFPNLLNTALDCINECCESQTQKMSKRVDEIFARSTENVASDRDLIDSINQLRFDRFETALREVMHVARDMGANPLTKDDLKQHVMDMLGTSYMYYHSAGRDPILQIEDARAAVKAYWRVCESRLNEDVGSCIELYILQRCSEMIENKLLSDTQLWLSNQDQLVSLVSESDKVGEERRVLKLLKVNIEGCLQDLDAILPDCHPLNPFHSFN